MDIKINNAGQAEMPFLIQCIERVRQHNNVDCVTIHVGKRGTERGNPQWIEYLMVFVYQTGGTMTVGALQRTLDADIEFHS